MERKIEDLLKIPVLPKFVDDKFNTWQTNYYTGLMRLQRINKNMNGAFYALYDLSDIGEIFNIKQIALRFGLEYKLKKKKKHPGGEVNKK